MLYASYGANLNKKNMETRTPTAVPLYGTVLKDWKLVFNTVADIRPSKGDEVQIGLWEIKKSDEKALDRFEGFPHLYKKKMIHVDGLNAMTYVMSRKGVALPFKQYYDSISQGYKDFGLDEDHLAWALRDAYRQADRTQEILKMGRASG